MNNTTTIEALQSHADQALKALESERQTESFHLPDLQLSGKQFYLADRPLSEEASRWILKILRVRPSFLQLADELPEQQWEASVQTLLKAQPELRLVATGPQEQVQRIMKAGEQAAERQVPFRPMLDAVCEGLAQSPIAYSLHDFKLDAEKQRLNLVLLDAEHPFQIVEHQQQAWHQGKGVLIDPMSVEISSYFERLICSNGIRRLERHGQHRLSQKRFNLSRLRNRLYNEVQRAPDGAEEVLQQAVSRLRQHEVSVAEFLHIRNYFSFKQSYLQHRLKGTENQSHKHIQNQYFFLEPINQAYGLDVEKTSRHWQRTATTGINALDFFNLLTWLGSHSEQTGLDPEDELWLQNEAAVLILGHSGIRRRLNGNRLDLEDVAPVVRVNYPRLEVMN